MSTSATSSSSTVYHALVEQFATAAHPWKLHKQFHEAGQVCLPALYDGLAHPDPVVRAECAGLMDHLADDRCLQRLVLSLHDPCWKVRRNAAHSIGCHSCKPAPVSFDPSEHLIKRIRCDDSIRVRRMATAMLHRQAPSRRVARFLRRRLLIETDRKLLIHLRWSLRQHEGARKNATL